MQKQEKRIVALSVAVTLLGGWVTIGEAAARGPENCANRIYSFPAEGACRTGQALLDFCSVEMSSHFGADCEATTASSCSTANGYVCSTQAP
jgi:hypothetical protein